ncbi:hypothetical protein ABT160_36140 [Streptomyces sp. NPDC001941]|uniref:hypothetical protein n=1 Tax=Streptomyces sp. NPDC001941 TaxID=3154659 RepID=UPI00332A7D32
MTERALVPHTGKPLFDEARERFATEAAEAAEPAGCRGSSRPAFVDCPAERAVRETVARVDRATRDEP